MKHTLNLLYNGSVKALYENPNDQNSLFFDFTDDFSVFDWGKMPDTINGKGLVLCLMGGLLMKRLSNTKTWQNLQNSTQPFSSKLFQSETYQALCKQGLASHFISFVNENLDEITEETAFSSTQPVMMKVAKAHVPKVERHLFQGQLLYEYPETTTNAELKFIPLEVVFRLGIPEGSSLLSRFQKKPELAQGYGFDTVPKAWDWFKEPIVEFYTKLEAEDRKLSEQEALMLSGLTFEQFETLYETAKLASIWLYQQYQAIGLDLWDGKFEFAWDTSKGLVLVDTIGLDEIRVTQGQTVLSKEFLRQFYRNTDWYPIIKKCQEESPEVFALEKNTLPQPPKLPQQLKQTAEDLYKTVLTVMQSESSEDRAELLTQLNQKLEQAAQFIKDAQTVAR